MQDDSGAILIAEIGSITTRLTLLDLVDGEYRLINQAAVLSSIEPPQSDATVAVLDAAAQIAEATGRVLLRGGQLLMPQNSERDGVDRFVAVTSASGLLALVITAIANDVSAQSALRASRCIYTSVLQTVTLDDAAKQSFTSDDRSWIERQVQRLMSLQPDAVLIAGGLEGGAEDAIKRLAHIVALTALRPHVDAIGQQRQEILARPVIYAGNSEAREHVLEALTGRSEPTIIANLRPSLEREQLEPARLALTRLYAERILPRLPGIASLQRLSNGPVDTVCAAQGVMTRFLAEYYDREVLTLDVGASNSAAFLASQGRYTPAVLGNCGTGYGISTILNERGVASVTRWLPFAMSEQDVTHWMLNKLLRPQIVPTSHEDVWIEYAVVREILTVLLDTLRDEQPALTYDMVVLSGGIFANAPHPAWALLALLDVLQPTLGSGATASIDLYVDSLGLLAAAGAIAPLDPDAAVSLCERDLLRSTPLATCLVALGSGKVGDVALEAELVPTRGKPQHISIEHGQIVRLPLDQGTTAQLKLRPGPGVRIGANAPGVEVSSDVAAISGSALGVVIDARGRPLRQDSDSVRHAQQLWDWLIALGANPGARPVTSNVSTPVVSLDKDVTSVVPDAAEATMIPAANAADEIQVPPPPIESLTESDVPRGKRISLDDLRQQEASDTVVASESAAAAPTNLESDLAQLRQTVEAPKKKGLFGRNK